MSRHSKARTRPRTPNVGHLAECSLPATPKSLREKLHSCDPEYCGQLHLIGLVCAIRKNLPPPSHAPVKKIRDSSANTLLNTGVSHYWNTFAGLISTPFEHAALIWGIVPLYFGLLLNELTSDKANFRTAIQSGFSFLWAGAQWLYPYWWPHHEINSMQPIKLLVTVTVILLGVTALISGFRKRFPRYGRFLGHTRFANYFMITIYPIQAHFAGMDWNWDRLTAIVLFAVPVWLALHFGLMPLRRR